MAVGREIWRTADGISWQPLVAKKTTPGNHPAGFGDPKNESVDSLAVFKNKLYAAVGRGSWEGIQVWRTDNGINWQIFRKVGFWEQWNRKRI
jgi:hypothetical protein